MMDEDEEKALVAQIARILRDVKWFGLGYVPHGQDRTRVDRLIEGMTLEKLAEEIIALVRQGQHEVGGE